MDINERLAATSFLLGMAHGGIASIIDSLHTTESKFHQLAELEFKLRTEINRLYYQDNPGISLQEPLISS